MEGISDIAENWIQYTGGIYLVSALRFAYNSSFSFISITAFVFPFKLVKYLFVSQQSLFDDNVYITNMSEWPNVNIFGKYKDQRDPIRKHKFNSDASKIYKKLNNKHIYVLN